MYCKSGRSLALCIVVCGSGEGKFRKLNKCEDSKGRKESLFMHYVMSMNHSSVHQSTDRRVLIELCCGLSLFVFFWKTCMLSTHGSSYCEFSLYTHSNCC